MRHKLQPILLAERLPGSANSIALEFQFLPFGRLLRTPRFSKSTVEEDNVILQHYQYPTNPETEMTTEKGREQYIGNDGKNNRTKGV